MITKPLQLGAIALLGLLLVSIASIGGEGNNFSAAADATSIRSSLPVVESESRMLKSSKSSKSKSSKSTKSTKSSKSKSKSSKSSKSSKKSKSTKASKKLKSSKSTKISKSSKSTKSTKPSKKSKSSKSSKSEEKETPTETLNFEVFFALDSPSTADEVESALIATFLAIAREVVQDPKSVSVEVRFFEVTGRRRLETCSEGETCFNAEIDVTVDQSDSLLAAANYQEAADSGELSDTISNEGLDIDEDSLSVTGDAALNTDSPTIAPSSSPSYPPTEAPSSFPSYPPTAAPSVSAYPTGDPTSSGAPSISSYPTLTD